VIELKTSSPMGPCRHWSNFTQVLEVREACRDSGNDHVRYMKMHERKQLMVFWAIDESCATDVVRWPDCIE